MIIKGKDLSTSIKEALKVRVEVLKNQYGRTPNLVVVLVGEDPGSVSYVTGKAKAANEVGIANSTIRLADTITEADLLALVDQLNNDDSVDGILVQLPLPKHIDENKIIAAISPEKDVDAFHPMNVAKLWLKQPCVLPCTP
ncbi:MAG: bifunctional 5,10-methylenetetrahydrofolate dehydrogenase/5,10-methenyltetrahydrofolate cyclohydrolase, partial [Alistipes sp.]|nr:bifunctional 5,10-methylenetetrahydrofolate dehydrogenase/5,10-methenyltetrahydrofolate cyclohydrolase [Alistipes sp.]